MVELLAKLRVACANFSMLLTGEALRGSLLFSPNYEPRMETYRSFDDAIQLVGRQAESPLLRIPDEVVDEVRPRATAYLLF